MSAVRDIGLWPQGLAKIEWATRFMPVLGEIGREFEREKPLSGLRVALSIHLEAKTACLARTLARGGAQVAVTGCNPLSTQDDVAAALAHEGYAVYAWHGVTPAEYTEHLAQALGIRPHLIIDDGGDLIALLHGSAWALGDALRGGCEETTTGMRRLRARARDGALRVPMIAVNDARCKHLFDNRYGTGQSVWDSIMRTTNLLVAGKRVVVAGYGWCGRGVAMRAAGLGARVIVTEVDPVRALEAVMDGHEALPMTEAAAVGDVFITTTGCSGVIGQPHFEVMKDGALLANAGHFDVEIDIPALRRMAREERALRPGIMGYTMADGRTLCLLAEGRLVNLAAGDGHPTEIMDMSFGVQALCIAYLAGRGAPTEPGVYSVPGVIDRRVAELKLRSLGMATDALTREQAYYLSGWGREA